MKDTVGGFGVVLAVVAWLAGMVLAPGWWKIAAFIFPPYPWYLITERLMQIMNLIPQ